MANPAQSQTINAHPTKAFFVDMLTRDIPLEQAILDLVDNSIDGAKRLAAEKVQQYEDRKVEIFFNKDEFKISDNCGGFDTDTAINYAFRFGRPQSAKTTAHSIGQFGVGMKRALFKFGKKFTVQSATNGESWAIDVDVPSWEADESGWSFPWTEFDSSLQISERNPGTVITVNNLRQEVSARFSTTIFENSILSLIKSKHRQFISGGMRIEVNGNPISASNIYLNVSDKLNPGTDILEFNIDGIRVTAKIIVGIGSSSPREAGWYVICNGRVVREADRRAETGWGQVEEGANKLLIPSYHNQYSRFRGIVEFDSEDSSKVPWNTTKTDVDLDSPVWQKTFERMLEMMRPVIDFLNDLDTDIDENTRENSPLFDHINRAPSKQVETFYEKANFTAPARGDLSMAPKNVKIQYTKPLEDIRHLEEELGVTSAKAVGEKTFDMILRRYRDQ